MPVYFCRKCSQDAGSRGLPCSKCGSRPRLPRSGRQTLAQSRAAGEDEAARRRPKALTEEAVRRVKEDTRRKREQQAAATPRKFAKKDFLSEEKILDLWQTHHGTLSKPLIRDFLAHPRLSQLLRTRGKFVRQAIPSSNKLEDIAENALRASREPEELKQKQEEYRKHQAKASWVDPRELDLGPIARTWLTHREAK